MTRRAASWWRRAFAVVSLAFGPAMVLAWSWARGAHDGDARGGILVALCLMVVALCAAVQYLMIRVRTLLNDGEANERAHDGLVDRITRIEERMNYPESP